MNLLLDTNVVIWMMARPERVRTTVRSSLRDPSNRVWVSAASISEISAKVAAGRLTFTDRMYADLEISTTWLNVTAQHAWRTRTLPLIHQDPFDRLLIAQAIEDGLTLVTGDHLLAEYRVPVLLT